MPLEWILAGAVGGVALVALLLKVRQESTIATPTVPPTHLSEGAGHGDPGTSPEIKSEPTSEAGSGGAPAGSEAVEAKEVERMPAKASKGKKGCKSKRKGSRKGAKKGSRRRKKAK